MTPRFVICGHNSIPQGGKQIGLGEEEDKLSLGQAGYRCLCDSQVGRYKITLLTASKRKPFQR